MSGPAAAPSKPLAPAGAPAALPAMPHHPLPAGNAPEARPAPDLPAILTGCAAGDEAAWREFLRLFGPELERLVMEMLHPADLLHPEDVVQEALLRLLRVRLRARHPGQVRTYLRRTVTSVLKDLHRRRFGGRRTGEAIARQRGAPPTPEQDLLHKDSYFRLLARVATTSRDPRRARRIVHGAVFEGMTSREIAPEVGLSPSGVDSLLGRLRQGARRRAARVGR